MAQRNSIDYSGSSWTSLFSTTPVTGDDVNVGTDASQVISTDLNQSAVDLDSLTFQHPSRLRIGSAAGPLRYELSGPLRWDQMAGHLYFQIETSAAPRIVVGGPNFNLVGGGTSTLIELTDRGDLFASEDVTLTAIDVYGGYGEIEAKSGDDYTLDMYAGELLTRRNLNTTGVYDATLRAEGGDATCSALTLGPGGKGIWSGGDITALNALTNSLFDAMGSQKPFTISTLNVADGADVRLPPWVTVSATNYLGRRASL